MHEPVEDQWRQQLEEQGLEVVRNRFSDRHQTGAGDGARIDWIQAIGNLDGSEKWHHPSAKFVREWISEKDAEQTESEQKRHAQLIRLARVAAWSSVIGVIVSIVGIFLALCKAKL